VTYFSCVIPTKLCPSTFNNWSPACNWPSWRQSNNNNSNKFTNKEYESHVYSESYCKWIWNYVIVVTYYKENNLMLCTCLDRVPMWYFTNFIIQVHSLGMILFHPYPTCLRQLAVLWDGDPWLWCLKLFTTWYLCTVASGTTARGLHPTKLQVVWDRCLDIYIRFISKYFMYEHNGFYCFYCIL
jgi:hypothetical protein